MKKLITTLLLCCLSVAFLNAQTTGNGQSCPGKPTMTDADGNVYETVQIGNQCWMKTNLRVAPSGATNGTASTTYSNTEPYYFVNPNVDAATYGYYYNWEAAKLACPRGWHLPSNAEWITLEQTQAWMDVSDTNASYCNYSGKLAGEGWQSSSTAGAPGNANDPDHNASGFGAFPAGYWARGFRYASQSATIWSSTERGTDSAWFRNLSYDNSCVGRLTFERKLGLSVRCLRDSVPTVTTTGILGVTPTGATCGGKVIDDGGFTVTDRGVCWSTEHNPTIADTHTSGGTGLGTFTSNITGLAAGTRYYARAYATNSAGTAYGEEVLITLNPCPGTPTVKDYDGHTYNTVQIGDQCWMRENLRTLYFADGTPVPAGSTTSSSTPYYYDYPSSNIPATDRGYLYNWAAAMRGAASSNANPGNVQGICPNGWHLPSDQEWTIMTDYVQSQSEYVCGENANAIAKALATSADYWNHIDPTMDESYPCDLEYDLATNNATGFSAVPAGYRGTSFFAGSGEWADFWSSTSCGTDEVWYRSMYYQTDYMFRGPYGVDGGLSVRCILDEPEDPSLGDIPPCPGTPTMTDYDGNIYNTVQIGNQCWMRENMRTTHSANGSAIAIGDTTTSATKPYYYNYTEQSIPLTMRGYLYNWPAAKTVCPVGWHLPTDEEWTTMEATLTTMDLTGIDGRGDHAATLAGNGWSPSSTIGAPGNITDPNHNASGFSAVPAGYYDGSWFWSASNTASFWSSTEYQDNSQAWYRGLYYNFATVNRYHPSKNRGFSVRCLRDVVNDEKSCPVTPVVIDVEGTMYSTVQIGNQCWMRENLRTTHYPDGTAIPATSSATSNTNPYYYNNSNDSLPLEERGYLYNWSAAKAACPTGWHLPTDAEWTAMEATLTTMDLSGTGYRGDHAAKLAGDGWASSSIANAPGNATSSNHNATGFSAVPAGYFMGTFNSSNAFASFWSCSVDGTNLAWSRTLQCDNAGVSRDNDERNLGLSVRCLRDSNYGDAQPCPGVSKVTDIDGNVYNTVKIGDQCWMRENMRTTKNAAGTPIPKGDGFTRSNTAPYYYNDTIDGENYSFNVDGYYYNWTAAQTVCPSGWHLPSTMEWNVLADYVRSQGQYTCGTNMDISKALSSTNGWDGYDEATILAYLGEEVYNSINQTCLVRNQPWSNNATGFSAYPSGMFTGYFDEEVGVPIFGYYGAFYFWTTSSVNNNGGVFSVDENFEWGHYKPASIENNPKDYGLSVRCIRDAAPAVTTSAILGATTTTATGGGTVFDDGGSTVTARGVCWSTSHNPTVADSHTSDGDGIGAFTSNIIGLSQGTTYYVRAYATNSAGTFYGQEVSFSTVQLCNPENQCELTFVLTDSYGDGWNGNAIQVTDAETGYVLGTLANEDLDGTTGMETQTVTLAVCNGRTLNFEWIFGQWPEETSYTVYDGQGEVVLSGAGGLSELVSYTINCCGSPVNVTVSGVTVESATISWEGSNDSYQIRYRTPAIEVAIFEEGFENGIPSTWTTIDQDGDGHDWFLNNYSSLSHTGTGNAASESYDLNTHEALTPDNWLITPLIDLQGTMKVWLRGQDMEDFDEHFAIYLSTTGNAVANFTTTLVGETVTTSNYTEYSADLRSYAGQQGYIAIRHFNCSDMNRLLIDDFGIFEDAIPAGEWHTVSSSTTSATLTGLTSATQYEVQVQGMCNTVSTEWSAVTNFATDVCNPEDQCELTFVLTDSYGDGWSGNAIKVIDATTGIVLATMANENIGGTTQTVTLAVCDGRTINFEWMSGEYASETSYTVYDAHGDVIFSGAGGFSEILSYDVTCTSPCPAISLPYTENFDNYTQSTTAATGVEPTCWELVLEDAAMPEDRRPQLYYNSSFAHSGSYSLKLYNRGVYAMPELELDDETSISQVKLNMYLRQANAKYQLQVGVWDGQTFVPVATFNNSTTDVEHVACDFSGYNGNGRRIAFRNTLGSGSTVAYSTNYLDDITLTINEENCSITLPYSENFEDFTTSTTAATGVEPTCWELVQQDAAMTAANRPQLYYKSDFAHSGGYSLKLYYRGIYAMPELELDEETSMSQVKLDMYLRQANAKYQLQVGVWDGQTFVPVATFNNSTTDVEHVTCNFSGYTGNGKRIAFRNTLGSGSTVAYSTNYLDDITLTINEESCSITLPYSENFEDYTTSTTAATGVEPTCWELVQQDATMTDANCPQLYYKSDFAHSGNYSLKLYYRGIYAMPELELDEETSFSQVKLDMYLRQANAKYQLQVGVWDGQMFVPVATFNNSTTDVEHVTCDFSSYTGNGRRIAFRNTLGSGSTVAYSTNYLDDITLSLNTSTGCEAITLPYSENFDSYTQSTTAATGVQPDCWELVRIDVPSMPEDKLPQLYYNSSFAHSGDYSLKLYNRGVYAMPELVLEEGKSMSQVKLDMYLRQANAAYQLEVGVWDGQEFVPVKRINNSTTNVEFVTCDFSNYTGNGKRIAFRNVLGSGTYAYSVNYLDDITLTVVENCSVMLPYVEPFEDYTTSTTAATGVEPTCWELVRTDATSMPDDKRPQIYYNSSFASSGNYSLKMGNRCVYAMPELELEGWVVPLQFNQVKLDMYLRQPNAAYQLEVGVWDDATNTFTPVATFNNSTTAVEHVTCDFSNYNGNSRRVAFRNTLGNGKTWDYSYNYLDDITLSRITNNKSAEVTNANTDAGMLGTDRDMVDIAVYPNPTKDFVNVQCTMNNVQCSGIEVIDVYGKVVRTVVEANNDSPTQINVSGLAAGMYFVRVTTDKGVVTKPFVKR